MAEEIQFLHDDLTNLTTELQTGFDDLKKKGKSISPEAKAEQLAHLQERLGRAKDVLQSFRVELREVLKEAGRATYADFEAKGKIHNANINKLATEIETYKTAEDKKELMAGAKKKKKGEEDPKIGNVVIEQAKEVQHESAAALARGAQLVQRMEEVGLETNLHLKSQTDQMKNTNADVQRVDATMAAASKAVRDISRRMASDKMIVCLALLLVAIIITIIVLKIAAPNLFTSSDPCSLLSLSAMQTVSQCMTQYFIQFRIIFDASKVTDTTFRSTYREPTVVALSAFFKVDKGSVSTQPVPASAAAAASRRAATDTLYVAISVLVRGESNALALTQSLRNQTAVQELLQLLQGGGVPGVLGLTTASYCQASDTCVAAVSQVFTVPTPAPTTQSPAPGTDGGTNTGNNNGGGSAGGDGSNTGGGGGGGGGGDNVTYVTTSAPFMWSGVNGSTTAAGGGDNSTTSSSGLALNATGSNATYAQGNATIERETSSISSAAAASFTTSNPAPATTAGPAPTTTAAATVLPTTTSVAVDPTTAAPTTTATTTADSTATTAGATTPTGRRRRRLLAQGGVEWRVKKRRLDNGFRPAGPRRRMGRVEVKAPGEGGEWVGEGGDESWPKEGWGDGDY